MSKSRRNKPAPPPAPPIAAPPPAPPNKPKIDLIVIAQLLILLGIAIYIYQVNQPAPGPMPALTPFVPTPFSQNYLDNVHVGCYDVYCRDSQGKPTLDWSVQPTVEIINLSDNPALKNQLNDLLPENRKME